MRLLSLFLSDYKNIKNQTFDFTSNKGYIALIGENGSGKSNLLEALGIIIRGLLNGGRGIPFDYTLEYEIDGDIYKRAKGKAFKNGTTVKGTEIQYPSQLIANYSGEALRLWHTSFEEYHMSFFNRAVKESYFIPRMLYVNKYCWEIALISLLCAADKPEVADFLNSCLGITDISSVTISFNHDDEKQESFQKHDALKWFKRVIADGFNNVNMKTLYTTDIISSSALIQKQDKCKTVFQYLYLLSQPKKNSLNKIDRLISSIVIKINDIEFSDLSEGEKKLILVLCITKVLGDKNSLILLDEPDAHIHIARKKEVLKMIESFDGQIILTTHSPIFVNQMADTHIFPIHEGKVLPQEKRVLLQKISNNELSVIDSACVISSKNIIITEGPDDIYHIKAAIDSLASRNAKYKPLERVSYVFSGGAKIVDRYFDEILAPLYNTADRFVFVFDYDQEGREGAKMVNQLIDSGRKKCVSVYYHKTYPVPAPDVDFYLEDFFDRATYGDIQLPNITGIPTYAELKKSSTWANSIKSRIQRHKKENTLSPNDYLGFDAFLDQLVSAFGF